MKTSEHLSERVTDDHSQLQMLPIIDGDGEVLSIDLVTDSIGDNHFKSKQ